MNVSLDKAIIFFISVSHLVSGIIVMPKSLNVLTCFILPPFAMNVSYCNVWLFCYDHALSLLCIRLKFFVFTLGCDCCKYVLQLFFRVNG